MLGTNTGHVPRHAKKYADLASEYQRIQNLRIGAFAAFVKDVQTGAYPSDPYLVAAPAAEMDSFRRMMLGKKK